MIPVTLGPPPLPTPASAHLTASGVPQTVSGGPWRHTHGREGVRPSGIRIFGIESSGAVGSLWPPPPDSASSVSQALPAPVSAAFDRLRTEAPQDAGAETTLAVARAVILRLLLDAPSSSVELDWLDDDGLAIEVVYTERELVLVLSPAGRSLFFVADTSRGCRSGKVTHWGDGLASLADWLVRDWFVPNGLAVG